MLLTSEELLLQKAATKAAGYAVATGAARAKFVPNEALTAGVYSPKFAGVQPAVLVPRRKGEPFEAIVFTSSTGKDIKISLSAIYNSIRVVNGMTTKPSPAATWQGEIAEPTTSYFRYGALSDMASEDIPDETSASGTTAVYKPQAINLTTKVVYVAPRFVDGKPVFDEKCELREAICVADYLSFPDTNAQK